MREATESPRIHVFVAEATVVNSELMERALRGKLGRNRFSVSACAAPSGETIGLLRPRMPDVALISANLADGPLAGLTVLRSLRIMWPRARAVILVDQPTEELVSMHFTKARMDCSEEARPSVPCAVAFGPSPGDKSGPTARS